LPWRTEAAYPIRIFHGVGLVVNDGARIGSNVVLRHGVTIGNSGKTDECPIIGDNVEIGAGAQLIGPISIGPGAIIGANAVVLTDVPAGAIAVGVPARIISQARNAGGYGDGE
jgi:serine O-acetyltransferase/putative colanic acid biosynthesis acetyltransferase WcaB